MEIDTSKNQLIELYGEDAIDLALVEIKELAKNSNISFLDKKYLELGIGFIMINAAEILEGKKKECSLKSLVSESFGEAAIYKYNVCGGEII